MKMTSAPAPASVQNTDSVGSELSQPRVADLYCTASQMYSRAVKVFTQLDELTGTSSYQDIVRDIAKKEEEARAHSNRLKGTSLKSPFVLNINAPTSSSYEELNYVT